MIAAVTLLAAVAVALAWTPAAVLVAVWGAWQATTRARRWVP